MGTEHVNSSIQGGAVQEQALFLFLEKHDGPLFGGLLFLVLDVYRTNLPYSNKDIDRDILLLKIVGNSRHHFPYITHCQILPSRNLSAASSFGYMVLNSQAPSQSLTILEAVS